MDAFLQILDGFTVWHWIGIGIVLLTLEVAIGTFDLLWVALAAFTTALFAWLAPAPFNGWEGELVWFGAVSLVLVFMGRTVFKGLRQRATTHPQLNDRQSQLIGRHGVAASAFDGGEGRVRIGDSFWAARLAEGATLIEGDDVVVVRVEGTTLAVKRK